MRFPARMLTTAVLAASVVGVGGGVVAVAAGTAGATTPPTYTCTGTLSAPGSVPAGTYQSLIMPAGSICEIPTPGPVTVLSRVVLQKGSGLATGVQDAGSPLKIVGGLRLETDAAFVAGLAKEVSAVNILGRVMVGAGALFYLGTEKPYKPPFASIQGPVIAQDASAVVIQNTTIGGPVSVSGGGAVNAIIEALSGDAPDTNYTDFEDDQIKGGITEVGYGGVWGGVIRTIMGSLTFAYNSQKTIDEYDIGSDIINGSAYCEGNNPAPNMGSSSGSPSIVHGSTFGDQAATCTGVPTGGTGPPG